ncbi:MAG: pyridoxamine 5'-phosphate oxidase [Ignavibacteriales bacterium]|nr:pyridoxamine 5'-phosphate oxidase [Ignavibacteriales bacterium]
MGFRKRVRLETEFSEDTVDRDPVRQLQQWMEEANDTPLREPSAATLATAGTDSQPTARIVLVKKVDASGLMFFTNYGSRKAKELDANPKASLLFFWDPLARQVRIEGVVQRVNAKESVQYFKTRPRMSQLSAWVSPQSRVISSRRELEEAVRRLELQYAGQEVPLPPFWGGYRLVPSVFEFWQGRENRLHDRLRFVRTGGGWIIERLAP